MFGEFIQEMLKASNGSRRSFLMTLVRLVTISGQAGTGKTLMAIAAGLQKTTDEDIYQKLLVSRPVFLLEEISDIYQVI